MVRESVTQRRRLKPIVALVMLSISLQGCAPMTPVAGAGGAPRTAINPCLDQSAQQVGSMIGAIAGGIIATKVSNAKYALPVGILAGAVIGNAIGNDVARRRCDLYKIAQKHSLDMRTVVLELPKTPNGAGGQSVGLSATVVDKGGNAGQFLPNSDVLSPAARAYFTEIAASYTPRARKQGMDARESGSIDQSKVLIVGHTDDHEDTRVAADLSERRARAVANVFRAAGVPESSIYFQGAGETLPSADNNTEAGRAANRRVEIVDVANGSVMASYLQSRVSTSGYFQPVVQAPTKVVAARQTPEALPRGNVAPERLARKTVASASRNDETGRKPLGPNAATKRPSAVAVAQASSATGSVHEKNSRPAAAAPRRELANAADRASPAKAAAMPAGAADQGGFDIGGERFDHKGHQVNVGESLRNYGFSLLPLAVADETPLRSCVDDRARISHSVKSLRTGAEYKMGEYQPGAYGTSWVGRVNGHLLSLNNVAVLREGALPTSNPNVLIFKNFSEKNGAARKPDFNIVPVVNTYAGSRGTLYRVFFEKGAPLRCIDVVLPSSGPFKAEQGFVYQDRGQQTFASEFKPEVPRI